MTLLLLFLLAADGDLAWQWPITTQYGVTAGFGEYRGLRFHMGLDFSTNDLEGEPLRAARAGRIYQIAAGENGYGRVIYLRHEDGYATVYAHLAAFGPEVSAALIEAGLDPKGTFGKRNVDIAVTRSQIMAYTGESGAGTPHLHFEVRRNDKPVNPLSLNFPQLPNMANRARIKRVLLVPLDADSSVNGKTKSYLVGQGVKEVRASGRIGVYAYAYISTDRGNRIAVSGMRLYQDQRLIGSWLPQQLSFEHYRHAGLIYDQAHSGFGPTQYAHCFDDRVTFLPEVPGFKQDGVVVVTGATQLRIKARNLAGDWFTRSLALSPKALRHPDQNFGALPVQPTSLSMTLKGDRITLRPGLPGTLVLHDGMVGMATGSTRIITPKPNAGGYDLRWRTEAGNLRRSYGLLTTGGKSRLSLGPFTVIPAAGLRLPTMAAALEPADPKLGDETLSFASPVLHFGRHGLPAYGSMVQFKIGDLTDPQHIGLYYWSFNKKRWRFLSNLDKPAKLNHLAPIVVARDLVDPVIGQPRVHPYFTGERVVIRLRDRGSGIDANTIEVSGPDGPLKGRWDGDRGWVVLPASEKRGPWSLTVQDRSGRSINRKNLRR